MLALHLQYINDSSGRRLLVVLPAEEFKAIMEQLDELEDIRIYDEAKAADEPSVDIDVAFSEIEARRSARP